MCHGALWKEIQELRFQKMYISQVQQAATASYRDGKRAPGKYDPSSAFQRYAGLLLSAGKI